MSARLVCGFTTLNVLMALVVINSFSNNHWGSFLIYLWACRNIKNIFKYWSFSFAFWWSKYRHSWAEKYWIISMTQLLVRMRFICYLLQSSRKALLYSISPTSISKKAGTEYSGRALRCAHFLDVHEDRSSNWSVQWQKPQVNFCF